MADKADKFYSKLSTLQDPFELLKDDPRRMHELRLKHSQTLSRMLAQPSNGGDPFYFALVQTKDSILVRELHGQRIDTAATDGKMFYWNPEFLESLDPNQNGTLLKHEMGHVFRFHCAPWRGVGWDPELKNIAYDYVDNGSLEVDHVKSGRVNKFPLFGGPLGEPIRLYELMDWIDGKTEFTKGVLRCYSDPLAVERTADSIYHEIQSRSKKSPRRCKKENGGCNALTLDPKTGVSTIPLPWGPGQCPKCGSKPKPGGGTGGFPKTLDTHMTAEGGASKEEVMADLMRAAETATKMRGTVPAEVEALLKELKEPTLRAADLAVLCFQQKAKDVGDLKDHTRFLRRPQYIYTQDAAGNFIPMHRLYQPKTHDFSPRWACLLDTSGSMSDDDIAFGLKETQVVASLHDSIGWIVPCDTKVYWDKKVEITSTADIRRTKVVGRGGTTLADFFRELPKELGTDLDLVMVVTDGGIDDIPINLAPNCQVIWVVTSGFGTFKPPFGRAVHLYPGVKGT